MFRAYGNRVLVDVTRCIPGRTKGGLHLPENTKIDPLATGDVISVGPGVMTSQGWDAPLVRVGDVVQFERGRASIMDRENNLVVVWAGDILAVDREADVSRLNGRQPSLVESN
jgi:co-chaperonin GroES (HSP10)